MSQIEVAEALGSVLGVLGALLLAVNSRWSGYGFIAFLASNVAWLIFGRHTGHWIFFAQQVVFTFASLLGIWRWLVQPRMDAAVHGLFKDPNQS